jgi:hypothetical protein
MASIRDILGLVSPGGGGGIIGNYFSGQAQAHEQRMKKQQVASDQLRAHAAIMSARTQRRQQMETMRANQAREAMQQQKNQSELRQMHVDNKMNQERLNLQNLNAKASAMGTLGELEQGRARLEISSRNAATAEKNQQLAQEGASGNRRLKMAQFRHEMAKAEQARAMAKWYTERPATGTPKPLKTIVTDDDKVVIGGMIKNHAKFRNLSDDDKKKAVAAITSKSEDLAVQARMEGVQRKKRELFEEALAEIGGKVEQGWHGFGGWIGGPSYTPGN